MILTLCILVECLSVFEVGIHRKSLIIFRINFKLGHFKTLQRIKTELNPFAVDTLSVYILTGTIIVIIFFSNFVYMTFHYDL